MASVHRMPGSRYWYAAFRGPDGRRHLESTKTTDKAEAKEIARAKEKAVRLNRQRRLTPERARKLIEDTIEAILELQGTPITRVTTGEFLERWVREKENSASITTHARYLGIVGRFTRFLGADKQKGLPDLTAERIQDYVDQLAIEVSASTVNTHIKVLRVAFGKAVKRRLLSANPAAQVETLSTRAKHRRRPFTLPELKKLLAVASEDWQTMILTGLYTGLRLQDIANLTWSNLDLQRNELTVETGKTGRMQILPIAKPLLRHIETLPAGDDPKGALCPKLEGTASSGLSNQFFELMETAGLVPMRMSSDGKEAGRRHHVSRGKGRGRRREVSELSFHCLRHTATSLLKNAGVSDVVARDIIGHESEAISRNYTHIDFETKRAALEKLPDVGQ